LNQGHAIVITRTIAVKNDALTHLSATLPTSKEMFVTAKSAKKP